MPREQATAVPRRGVAARPAGRPPATEPAPSGAHHERRTTARRRPAGRRRRPTLRLGDVYAEELERLRQQAHAEGFAAGHAEGMTAAAAVVAEAERAAAERLAEVQARWERRIASATAALGAAATRLDEAAVPAADDIRETVLGTVLTLVEDLLGRELALADSPALDALRRALALCPADAPVVVRVHPDDLAEIPAEALAELPDTVRVVGDAGGRAGRGGRRDRLRDGSTPSSAPRWSGCRRC